jgi:hypothetical protein
MKHIKEVLLFLKNNFFILLPILLVGISEILVMLFNINPFIVLSLISLSSIISIYLLYKELLNYSIYFKSKIVLVIISMISLTIAYLSNIYVNKYIVEFVHVKPSLFPLAQQLLFPFIGIILWVMLFYVLLLAVLLIFILKTFLSEYKNNKNSIKFLGKKIHKINNNSFMLNISIILGISIALTVLFPLLMKFLFSNYYKNEIIKKVFIFSSYYSNHKKQICENIDENNLIAFLNKDNISYIDITDNNITFKLDKCIKKSNKTLERNSLP